MPQIGGWELTPSSFAFLMCMVVVFVDMMGQQFCAPVLTPYGIFLGLNRKELGSLLTATAAGQVLSSFVLPVLSDKRGRKVAVIVSTTGSMFAYFLQGVASAWNYPSSYGVMLTGKAVSGLFAGTMSILTAYLTEISDGNYDLVKQRMTMMVMIQQQGGHLLGPVAGSIAVFGLGIPFIAAASTAFIAVPFLIFFFQNPDVVKARELQYKESPLPALEGTKAESSSPPETKPAPSKPKGDDNAFWQDPVMILYFLCYACIGFVAIAVPPLLAFLLQYPSFGLLKDDEAETQGRIAQVASLAALPQGALQSFFMVLVSPVLTKRIGGTNSGLVGLVAVVTGIGGVACLAWFGDDGSRSCNYVEQNLGNHSNISSSNTTTYLLLEPYEECEVPFQAKIWMVCICMGFFGLGLGLQIPLLLASGPRYRGIKYPNRLAAAGAFCTRGVFAGMMMGGPVCLGIYEAVSLGMAWLTIGSAGFLFFLLFVIADQLATKTLAARQAKAPVSSTPQRQAFQCGALEQASFVAEVQQMLADVLQEQGYCTWSLPEQALVRAQLRSAFPKLQPWSDHDGGFLHNLGVARQLRRLGENDDLDLLQELAPGISLAETQGFFGDGLFANDPTMMLREISNTGEVSRSRSGNQTPTLPPDDAPIVEVSV